MGRWGIIIMSESNSKQPESEKPKAPKGAEREQGDEEVGAVEALGGKEERKEEIMGDGEIGQRKESGEGENGGEIGKEVDGGKKEKVGVQKESSGIESPGQQVREPKGSQQQKQQKQEEKSKGIQEQKKQQKEQSQQQVKGTQSKMEEKIPTTDAKPAAESKEPVLPKQTVDSKEEPQKESPPQQLPQQPQIPQQPSDQTPPIEPQIKPYHKISLQPLDLKTSPASLTLPQFLQLCQSQNHTITPQQAQQVVNTYGNEKEISAANASNYFSSLKYGHVLDLKLDVWRQFNSFKNLLSSQGIHYKPGDTTLQNTKRKVENHDIRVSFKSEKKEKTSIHFNFEIGAKINTSDALTLEICVPIKDSSTEQLLRSSIQELTARDDAVGQLLRCFSTEIKKQQDKLRLTLQSKDIVIVTDTIQDLKKYIEGLGEDFKVSGGFEIEGVGRLSELLERESQLGAWLLEGFGFRCKASGNEGWISSLRKYLSLVFKEKDRQLAHYVSLLRNSKVNVEFKAPENANEFLTKLGIDELVKKAGSFKKAFQREEKEQTMLRDVLGTLKKVLSPLFKEELKIHLRAPFATVSLQMQGDSIPQLLEILI